MATPIQRIVFIGAGHVAWHLGQQLIDSGLEVAAVWSRQHHRAATLAEALHAQACDQWSELPTDADIYLIAVADQGISDLAKHLAAHLPSSALVMHTSGATPTSSIGNHFRRAGVFYPLQTFSRGREVDFSTVPICIHTLQADDLPRVRQLAERLSQEVHVVDDEQRTRLHLAAVFVNNFTNYLQHIARTLAEEHGLDATMLQPLLRETVAKLDALTPAQAQTGPAIRHDTATIERHLALLAEHPHWQALYAELTREIQRLQ